MTERQTDRQAPVWKASRWWSVRPDSKDVLSLAQPVLVIGVGGWLLHFLLTWRIGLNVADEGFYWYGAQRVLLGEVPLRDFMSYDIGRYLWAAGWMHLISDDGLFAARLAAFSCVLPLLLVLLWLVLAECPPGTWLRWLWAGLAVSLLLLWQQPYYKNYDVAASTIVLTMAWLMLKAAQGPPGPQPWWRWAAAGFLLGSAGVIGRNHGLYGAIAAAFSAFLLVRQGVPWRTLLRGVGPFLGGLSAGLLPMWALLVTAPGFAQAIVESIAEQIRLGKSNLELPFPQLWDVDWSTLGLVMGSRDLLLYLLFAAVMVVPVVVLIAALLMRRVQRPLLLAAAVTAVPYSHYVFSRADIVHLAGAILPFLVLLLAWLLPHRRLGAVAMASVLLASVFALSQWHPVLRYVFWPEEFIGTRIEGDEMFLRRAELDAIRWPLAVLEAHGSGSATRFLAVPDMPTLYALRRVPSPVWEIYMLDRRDSGFVDRQLAGLSAAPPEIVLLRDNLLGEHEDRRLRRVNPRLLSWIETHCQELPAMAGVADLHSWRCAQRAETAAFDPAGTPEVVAVRSTGAGGLASRSASVDSSGSP